jgi:hypothetical protein
VSDAERTNQEVREVKWTNQEEVSLLTPEEHKLAFRSATNIIRMLLKGQSHEIFDLCFFSSNIFP